MEGNRAKGGDCHLDKSCRQEHNSEMPTQLLTVGQVKTIRQHGGVEFVTRDALIQPDRYKFANLDELTAYLGQVVGGKPDGGGIRGSNSLA